MFLAWLRFSILISNIIISNQLSPPAIMTSTKCAIENQKIQGFNPSQFFQCVRKENELYFETRYCPSVKNTFYEAEQRCLLNIGGGEVRCLIPGKRCSHNQLGPIAYPNKFKPNYYIVCLPKATHICRCYGNAIYDASTQMCRIISTTTDMGRDDSNGTIPKIICERSGMHSTVELEHPNKQKCVLFCYQKDTNDQFKLNIICAPKTNLVDANVPMINPSDIDRITNDEENLPPEIRELIAQELLKSTNSYDNLGWPLEKSTTENSQDKENQKQTDITSIPTGETFLESSSTEDLTITWATDQNSKEKPFDYFSFKYDENTSKNIVLISLPTEVGSWSSDIFPTLNERATSTQLSEFSPTEGKPDIQTTDKGIPQEGSVKWNSDKILIPFLNDDETTIQSVETSLSSSTIQDGTTQSDTNQNFKESHANTPVSTTEYESVQLNTDKNFTQKTSSSLFSITENGSTQSTIDINFNERSSSQLNLLREEGTTITSVSYTTEDGKTKWTTNQNTIETQIFSRSQFTTTENIIKSSSEKTSLVSLIAEDEEKQRTQNQNFKKSTANTLNTIMEDKTTNQFSENLLLAGVSTPSTAYHTFTKTPKTPFSTTNPGTKLLTEEETTNPSKITITTESGSTKWTINQNTMETSLSSQFLTTEDKIASSSDKTSLATLIPEDGKLQWTTDQNLKKSTSNTLSTIIENKTTNQFNENLSFSSVTPEEKNVQTSTHQNLKETSSIPFSATDDVLIKKANPGTKLPITEGETTNPSKTIFTSVSNTTQDKSTKSTTNQNTEEISTNSQFLTTEFKIISTSDKTSSISLIPEDEDTEWTIDEDLKSTTANTLSTLMEDETANQFSKNPLLASVTPEEVKSTAYQIFTKTTKTPFSTTNDGPKAANPATKLLITEEGTTNPSKTTVNTVNNTTEDGNTKWTINQNTIETSSSSQSVTTKDKIILSGVKTSLISLIPEDGETVWTIDQDFKKSTANTLSTITENETTDQSSETPLLGSETPKSLQFFIETSRTPFSTTDDGSKEKNSGTKVIVTEKETTITTLVTDATDGRSSKWTTSENPIQTSFSTQFLTTENILKSSSEKISLVSLTDKAEQWTSDQNFKKTTANTLSSIIKNEKTDLFSENILFSSETPERRSMQSTIYQDFKETSSIPFLATSDTNFGTKLLIIEEQTNSPSKTEITSVSHTTEDINTKWTTNQNTIETSSSSSQFLPTENIINTSSDKTSLENLTSEETQWPTNQNLKINTANTLNPIMDDETTNPFSENPLFSSVTPERESMQSTTYWNFKETSSIPFSATDNSLKETNFGTKLLITEQETTNPSKIIITSVSHTTEDINTEWTSNQNTIETSSSSNILTTGDILKSLPEDTDTTDKHFKKSTANTLSPILEDETTKQSNENLLLASVTPEGDIMQSTAYQTSIKTSRLPYSTANDVPKETNFETTLIVIDEETTTNPLKTIISSVTYATEDRGTKWITNQNTIETSSTSQFSITENIINTSNDKTSLASLTPVDGETQWTTDQNLKKSTAIILSTIIDNKITNQFSEHVLLPSVTPEGESIKSTSYQNLKETTPNTPFSTTVDADLIETSSGTIFLITDDATTNQSNKNLLFDSVTPEGESIQSTSYQNLKESSSTQFSTTVDSVPRETNSGTLLLITDDEITNHSNKNSLLASVTPEGDSIQSTPYQYFKESTPNNQFSTTFETDLTEASSSTPLLMTENVTTNQSNKKLLLDTTTPEGESMSTIYQDLKKTSDTPFSTTVDFNPKETSSSNLLLITDDEMTNLSNKNLLLESVTPEGESIKSTLYQNFKESTSNTQFSTTVSADLKETNSDTKLLVTEDVTINESSEKLVLQSTTPEGESTQFSPYDNFEENTSNSLFSTTEDGEVDFKQTTSIALSPITEDKTIKSSSENNLLGSVITEDESVRSTPNKHFKQTTSSTRFSITDETITPTSEIIAVESLSTKSGNINSTENLNSFASPSTTESLIPNWTEVPETEVTSRTDSLSSITKQLSDKTTQKKLNTTPSPTTSEILTAEAENETLTLKETSSATYDDSTKLNYTPAKSDQVTLNLENNLKSTISKSTLTPTTILFSSNTQSQEIETNENTLYLQTNIPKENVQSTTGSPYSTSDIIVPSTAIPAFSKNNKENLLSTTSLNGYSQSISTTEDTAKPVDHSTTSENLITTEIDTRLPVQSSTASGYYEYQSIIPVSDITNSVNTLLPAEAISENTPENSQQISTSVEVFESKEYSTEISSTGYSSTIQTTVFTEPADSEKDDYSTKLFTKLENVKSNSDVEKIDSDQNINGSPQPPVELEISTIAIKPNWDVTDETSTSESFASNKYLEESESQGTYFGMAERCVCTGKRRYRNSCKKHYHCSKIGSLNRFMQSEIMECPHCLQFNAKKRICDFPENVPECAVDDGSFNRRCTAVGNYSIPLERNCRKYYECKRNWRGVIVLQVKICQVGRIFSDRLQKCVKGCRCRNAQQLPDRCEYKNAVLPDRFDCSKYYYCNNKMEIKTLQCSDQYVFDGEKCELKSEVICDPSKVYRYLSDDDDENCNT